MKAEISYANIKGYVIGHLLFALYQHSLLPKHIVEQVENVRMKRCFDCLANGECLHCGCQTPQKFFDPRPCSAGKYPKLMSRWDYYLWKLKQSKDERADVHSDNGSIDLAT